MSNAVGCGFDHRSGQTKDYALGMCSFSTKHVSLRRKSTDWLTRNQDSVSEWGACLSNYKTGNNALIHK
jgi:hypothetical protein